MYINKKCQLFPCFIETYNIYSFENYNDWFNVASSNSKKIETIKTRLKKVTFNNLEKLLGFACRNAKYLALSIENIGNAFDLEKKLLDIKFIDEDLMNVLYQIYMPLSVMSENFTHYDLHESNVMIEELPDIDGKQCYIEYEYKYVLDETSVKFKSKYKAKIIDYGRCFFNDPDDPSEYGSSKMIKQVLCSVNVPDCKTPSWMPSSFYDAIWRSISISDIVNLFSFSVTRCGEEFGFKKITDDFNMHQDLSLYQRVYNIINKNHKSILHEIKDFFEDTHIKDVNDVHDALKEYVLADYEYNETKYKDYICVGRLTIYDSGEIMKYEECSQNMEIN
jgi:hypothetical protein